MTIPAIHIQIRNRKAKVLMIVELHHAFTLGTNWANPTIFINANLIIHAFNSAKSKAFNCGDVSSLACNTASKVLVCMSLISNASLSARYAFKALVITRDLVPLVFVFKSLAIDTGILAEMMVFSSPMISPFCLLINK